MSTTNTTNNQGSDAPKASENKSDAEKQTTKEDIIVVKAEDETKADVASSEESKPDAMDVTASAETKVASEESEAGDDNTASETKKKPRRLKGAARNRLKWLLDQGYSKEEADILVRDAAKTNQLRFHSKGRVQPQVQVADNEVEAERKARRLKRLLKTGYHAEDAIALSRDLNAEALHKPLKKQMIGVLMTVVPTDYPVTTLTEEQANIVKSAILKQVVQQKGVDFKPQFEDCYYKSDYLFLHCSDQHTVQWVQKILPKLELWENASVKTISEKKLLKIDVFVGTFPDSRQDSNKDILDFVESQNDGLSTSEWVVISRKDTDKQTIELTFTVDAPSAKIIHDEGYRLNYKFGKTPIRRKNTPEVVGSTTNANKNAVQKNTKRGQMHTNRVPPGRAPKEQKTSSSASVPIWDSNLPKGGSAPNPPKWGVTSQRRNNRGTNVFNSNRNIDSSNRNSNSNLYDVGSRNRSYGGNSYGSSSYGGGVAQPSRSQLLSQIDSLYDELNRTVARSSGSSFNRQESTSSFDRNISSQQSSDLYDPSDCFRQSTIPRESSDQYGSSNDFDQYGLRRGNGNGNSNDLDQYDSRSGNGSSNNFDQYGSRRGNGNSNDFDQHGSRSGNVNSNNLDQYGSRRGYDTRNDIDQYDSRRGNGNGSSNNFDQYDSRPGNSSSNNLDQYGSRRGNGNSYDFDQYGSRSGNGSSNNFDQYSSRRGIDNTNDYNSSFGRSSGGGSSSFNHNSGRGTTSQDRNTFTTSRFF